MKGNLTLRLDQAAIRKAKLLAAARGVSVSRLLADYVERELGADAAYEKAMKKSLALMRKGWHLGGVRAWTREELHERSGLR